MCTHRHLISNQIQGGHEKSGLRNTILKQEFFLTAKEANKQYFSVHLFVKLLIPFLSVTCFFLTASFTEIFTEYLLHDKHCSKYFTSINSLNPYSPIRWVELLSLFYI